MLRSKSRGLINAMQLVQIVADSGANMLLRFANGTQLRATVSTSMQLAWTALISHLQGRRLLCTSNLLRWAVCSRKALPRVQGRLSAADSVSLRAELETPGEQGEGPAVPGTAEELFGPGNRAGTSGTLHRITSVRATAGITGKNRIIGLTYHTRRHVPGEHSSWFWPCCVLSAEEWRI
jgi:hypothetical protein